MPFFDYHLHTRFSSCCKFEYEYPDVAENIKLKDMDGFGVSDHCNYRAYNPKFLIEQRAQQKDMGLEQTGLVGLEISIIDKRGNLGIHPKYLSAIDYKIISEHVHIAKIFSGFFGMKEINKRRLEQYPKTKSKIDKDLDRLMPLRLNGIKKHPHSILAHILNFPLSIGYFPLKLFDMADKILAQLQESNVALEIHARHVKNYNLDPIQAEKRRISGEITLPEFYRYLYHRAKNYSIKFALGSDAHNLANILHKNEWKSFLSTVGISESQLITPDFFKEE